MAFDKKKNPFYPPRKESLMKEIGTTLGVVVVCVFLVGIIVKNFNYVTVANRQDSEMNSQSIPESDNSYDAADSSTDISAAENPDAVIEDASINPDIDPSVNESESMPTATPTPGPTDSDYIISDSHTRYITEADLQNLTQEQLRIARNEIYARHGRLFKDEALQAYFNSKSWYAGTIPPDNFTQEMLSDIERANTAVISDYEAKRGY